MEKNKFADVMAGTPNEELLDIVTRLRNDYQPEAIVAAETELKKRNLGNEQLLTAKQKVEQKVKGIEERANEPLSTSEKLLSFFLPFRGLLLTVTNYHKDGYETKLKQLTQWRLFGVVFYILLILILSRL